MSEKLLEELRQLAGMSKGVKTLQESRGVRVLEYILDPRNFHGLFDKLNDAGDEQSVKLLYEVYNRIDKMLTLSSDDGEAFNRLVECANNYKRWDSILLRNNIFKAANAMGMKLPSHSF